MERLHRTATPDDLPRLRALLLDESAFVREAAAWPLAELAGATALPDLFDAYQRGLDEGHDNDGFTTALIELAAADTDGVRQVLETLARSGNEAMRENAHGSWSSVTMSETHDHEIQRADEMERGGRMLAVRIVGSGVIALLWAVSGYLLTYYAVLLYFGPDRLHTLLGGELYNALIPVGGFNLAALHRHPLPGVGDPACRCFCAGCRRAAPGPSAVVPPSAAATDCRAHRAPRDGIASRRASGWVARSPSGPRLRR